MITFYHLNPFVFHMKSSFHLAKLLAPPCGSKVYNEIPLILSAKSNVDIIKWHNILGDKLLLNFSVNL